MWSGCIFERNIITLENTSTPHLHGAIKSIAHGRIFESPSEVAHVCICKSVCNSVRWKYTTFVYYVHGGLHPQSIFQSFERKGESLIKFQELTCAWVNKWTHSRFIDRKYQLWQLYGHLNRTRQHYATLPGSMDSYTCRPVQFKERMGQPTFSNAC